MVTFAEILHGFTTTNPTAKKFYELSSKEQSQLVEAFESNCAKAVTTQQCVEIPIIQETFRRILLGKNSANGANNQTETQVEGLVKYLLRRYSLGGGLNSVEDLDKLCSKISEDGSITSDEMQDINSIDTFIKAGKIKPHDQVIWGISAMAHREVQDAIKKLGSLKQEQLHNYKMSIRYESNKVVIRFDPPILYPDTGSLDDYKPIKNIELILKNLQDSFKELKDVVKVWDNLDKKAFLIYIIKTQATKVPADEVIRVEEVDYSLFQNYEHPLMQSAYAALIRMDPNNDGKLHFKETEVSKDEWSVIVDKYNSYLPYLKLLPQSDFRTKEYDYNETLNYLAAKPNLAIEPPEPSQVEEYTKDGKVFHVISGAHFDAEHLQNIARIIKGNEIKTNSGSWLFVVEGCDDDSFAGSNYPEVEFIARTAYAWDIPTIDIVPSYDDTAVIKEVAKNIGVQNTVNFYRCVEENLVTTSLDGETDRTKVVLAAHKAVSDMLVKMKKIFPTENIKPKDITDEEYEDIKKRSRWNEIRNAIAKKKLEEELKKYKDRTHILIYCGAHHKDAFK